MKRARCALISPLCCITLYEIIVPPYRYSSWTVSPFLFAFRGIDCRKNSPRYQFKLYYPPDSADRGARDIPRRRLFTIKLHTFTQIKSSLMVVWEESLTV